MAFRIPDEVVYALLLLLSVPFGLVIRSISSPRNRELVSTLAGVTLMLLTCGKHVWHSILTTAVNTCIISAGSRNRFMQVASFLWCFGYLAFFRTCERFGVETPSATSNALQLLLTLRLVGVAAEVMEMEKLKAHLYSEPSDETASLKLKYRGIDYSWYRLFSYSFCYVGALTGPFYTCRTFQDMINNSSISSLPLWADLKHRLKPLPICAVLFLLLSWSVSVKRATEDSFYEETCLWYRYGYLFLLFIWFRVRFYTAWILAETVSVMAGLGGYPSRAANRSGAGPTDLKALDNGEKSHEVKYDFETIRNILPIEIEKSSSLGGTIRHWNMAVQWWLVAHVYKTIPIRNKFIRSIIVMVISSFWHGVHPGYYATLLSSPFLLLAEDGMNRGVRKRLVSDRQRNIYDTIAGFVTMRFFEYYAVGAFFLHYGQIYRFWLSVYFYGHISLFVMIVVGQTLSFFARNSTEKSHES